MHLSALRSLAVSRPDLLSKFDTNSSLMSLDMSAGEFAAALEWEFRN